MQNGRPQTIRERVQQESRALLEDIEWLETQYAPIKETWIAAENRRRRIYEKLREEELLEVFFE